MDGIHDVGGKLGFGPIKVSHEDPPFAAEWEGRMLGIARALSRPADWNSDKFRHTRELEAPVTYLTRPYLDQWYKAYACMLVGAGLVTVEELASGVSAGGSRPAELAAPMTAADVATARHAGHSAEGPYDGTARFSAGDRVLVRNIAPTGHTRIPAYIKAREGEVFDHRGNHCLPDTAAHNVKKVEPLYTVRFRLADLFPERAGSPDTVLVDLWESYLDPA